MRQVDRLLNGRRGVTGRVRYIERLASGQALDDLVDVDTGLADLRMQLAFWGDGDDRSNAVGQLGKRRDVGKGFERVKENCRVGRAEVASTVVGAVGQPVCGAENICARQQVKVGLKRLLYLIEGVGSLGALVGKELERHRQAEAASAFLAAFTLACINHRTPPVLQIGMLVGVPIRAVRLLAAIRARHAIR